MKQGCFSVKGFSVIPALFVYFSSVLHSLLFTVFCCLNGNGSRHFDPSVLCPLPQSSSKLPNIALTTPNHYPMFCGQSKHSSPAAAPLHPLKICSEGVGEPSLEHMSRDQAGAAGERRSCGHQSPQRWKELTPVQLSLSVSLPNSHYASNALRFSPPTCWWSPLTLLENVHQRMKVCGCGKSPSFRVWETAARRKKLLTLRALEVDTVVYSIPALPTTCLITYYCDSNACGSVPALAAALPSTSPPTIYSGRGA